MAPVLHSPELAEFDAVSTHDTAWAHLTHAEREAYLGGDWLRWIQWTAAHDPVVFRCRPLRMAEQDRVEQVAVAYGQAMRAQLLAAGMDAQSAGQGAAAVHMETRFAEAFRVGCLGATRGERSWTPPELATLPRHTRHQIGSMILARTELPDPFFGP